MKAAIVALLFVVGCDGGETPPDARRPELPPPDRHCAATCGNGKIDDCWRTMNSSATLIWTRETCDGTAVENLPSCESLGLCGTSKCPSACLGVDASECRPCN